MRTQILYALIFQLGISVLGILFLGIALGNPDPPILQLTVVR